MTLRAALACTLLFLLAGCPSSGPEPRGCEGDAQCGEGAICVGGVCAGNAAPSGSFTAPTGVTTNRLVRLEANTTDPEGRELTHRWSVEPRDGGCAADVEPGDRPWADVAFWCPGTYGATVVPIDDQGLEGDPLEATLVVAEATGAPTVVAGGAISATHSCDLAIPECHVVGPNGSAALALSAAGTNQAGGALTYEWVAIPPQTAAFPPELGPSFAPDNLVAAPAVSITNDGGPIAGLYRFRVRVQNAEGLIAQAFQEVVAGNRAPVVASNVEVLAHTYADGLYVAEGDLVIGATDADGDALFVETTLSPAPPADCEESAVPSADGRVHVRIACSIPGALIGETARSLSGAARDANGAAAAFTTSLVIANRRPILALDPSYVAGGFSLDHRVEPCTVATGAFCFVVEGPDPFVAVDPDGDPLGDGLLNVTVTSRPSSRGTVIGDGNAKRFRFETPTTLPAEFRSAAGETGFKVSTTVADGFGARGIANWPLTITNRAPVIKEAVATASPPHRYEADTRRYKVTVNGPVFEDPDGDPLSATVSGDPTWSNSVTLDAGRAVIAYEYAWDYTVGGEPPLSEILFARGVGVTASDGWASITPPTMTLTIQDRPGTVTAPVTSVENCACVSGKYAASGTGLSVPVELVDPDGDPHLVTATPASDNLAAPVPATCVPGWCYPKVYVDTRYNPWGYVRAVAGTYVSEVNASFSINPTCSLEGRACP